MADDPVTHVGEFALDRGSRDEIGVTGGQSREMHVYDKFGAAVWLRDEFDGQPSLLIPYAAPDHVHPRAVDQCCDVFLNQRAALRTYPQQRAGPSPASAGSITSHQLIWGMNLEYISGAPTTCHNC